MLWISTFLRENFKAVHHSQNHHFDLLKRTADPDRRTAQWTSLIIGRSTWYIEPLTAVETRPWWSPTWAYFDQLHNKSTYCWTAQIWELWSILSMEQDFCGITQNPSLFTLPFAADGCPWLSLLSMISKLTGIQDLLIIWDAFMMNKPHVFGAHTKSNNYFSRHFQDLKLEGTF